MFDFLPGLLSLSFETQAFLRNERVDRFSSVQIKITFDNMFHLEDHFIDINVIITEDGVEKNKSQTNKMLTEATKAETC